jgi:3-carboxy-cis,cis-muconate cycloisomerase
LVAASQTAELVAGLRVHTDLMAANLAAAGESVLAEQRSMTDHPSPTYLGDAAAWVDEVVARARRTLDQITEETA